jgi:hypothetical protein
MRIELAVSEKNAKNVSPLGPNNSETKPVTNWSSWILMEIFKIYTSAKLDADHSSRF